MKQTRFNLSSCCLSALLLCQKKSDGRQMMANLSLNSFSFAPKKNDWWCQKRKLSVVHSGRPHWEKRKSFSSVSVKSMAPNDHGKRMVPHVGVDTAKNNGSLGTSSVEMNIINEGVGIVEYLQGKSFFITGATGFLAKVLVEKILRSIPECGKLYLLIRAKDKETAMWRLETEIIDCELFEILKQKYEKSYRDFMLSKLVPVAGDTGKPYLSLAEPEMDMVAREVDVIVNSAANTTLDERYDVAMNMNTRGPSRLMDFAKRCKSLKLFLQVSTAYTNGKREGVIMEKPFRLGESMASDIHKVESLSTVADSTLDIENEMQLVLSSREAFKDHSLAQEMKKLGLERAKKHGWTDTYTFTKAMGEMMIDKMRGEIPVVIIRPSVIEGSYREPFPGWIQGNRMMDPLVLSYGKGRLTCLLADPNCILDVVPVDAVVNATLAAIAVHGAAQQASTIVYHVGSSVVNPLTVQELFTTSFEHLKSNPLLDKQGRPINITAPIEFCKSMNEFSAHLRRHMAKRTELVAMDTSHSEQSLELKLKTLMKMGEKLSQLSTVYEPYCFYKGRFDCSNTQKLMERMSDEEKLNFGFNLRSIDWKDYIANIHIPGLRKHVMKENKLSLRST